MTFEEVWKRSSFIRGWFAKASAKQLFDIAMTCNAGAVFVEIGTYCGRSASVLGQVAMHRESHLTCVDTFGMNYSAAFVLPNLQELGIECTVMMMRSERAAKIFCKSIDLLLIDSNHSEKWIRQDCTLWLPKLREGGWVLFHDYGPGWPGVVKVVDELEGYEDHGVIKSLATRRKVES